MVWALGRKADQARNAPAPATPTYTTIELGALLREYEDNEVRADATYKGRRIRVEGIATGVSKGVMGGAFVTLGTTGELEIPSVQCLIEPSTMASFMNVSKGNRVAVQGRVDGLLMNVLLKDCELAR
jgi:hypothetical protein